jgi:hypothetical protein
MPAKPQQLQQEAPAEHPEWDTRETPDVTATTTFTIEEWLRAAELIPLPNGERPRADELTPLPRLGLDPEGNQVQWNTRALANRTLEEVFELRRARLDHSVD